MLQQRNIFDPIMYMMKRLQQRQAVTSANAGDKRNCLEIPAEVELVYENSMLKRVVSANYVIELVKQNGVLSSVTAVCANGYSLVITLTFTNGVLTNIQEDETQPSLPDGEITSL